MQSGVNSGNLKSKTATMLLAAMMAISLAITLCCGLAGCGSASSSRSIVGSWAPSGGSGSTMTFYESGNCEHVTYKSRTSDTAAGHYTKYELESDGTVFIIGDYWGDRAATIKQTSDQAKAANDYDFYCIDGDTLIWDKKVYKRA